MGEAGVGTTRARQLRHHQTGPERALWRILWSFRQGGWHFRRQQPIGPYYADFACLHAGLIVEVDGETHVDAHRDAVRDDYMRSRGLHVLRFTNDDVLHHPDAIFTTIAGVLRAVSSTSNTPHPVPPPQGGRRPSTPTPSPRAETAGLASPSPLRGGDRGGGTPQAPDSQPGMPHTPILPPDPAP